jgi:hypothetical protein
MDDDAKMMTTFQEKAFSKNRGVHDLPGNPLTRLPWQRSLLGHTTCIFFGARLFFFV